MQDNVSVCKHCSERIVQFRGAWFGRGDTTQCLTSTIARSHEPDEPTWMRQARTAGWRPPEGKQAIEQHDAEDVPAC